MSNILNTGRFNEMSNQEIVDLMAGWDNRSEEWREADQELAKRRRQANARKAYWVILILALVLLAALVMRHETL